MFGGASRLDETKIIILKHSIDMSVLVSVFDVISDRQIFEYVRDIQDENLYNPALPYDSNTLNVQLGL